MLIADLVSELRKRQISPSVQTKPEMELSGERNEGEVAKHNDPTSPIKAAPSIQDTEAQEKELDELLDQLKKVNRHWKVEWARGKKVPLKALLHAANLWLSDDTDDWTAANDTIHSFTSPFGLRQLQYPNEKR